MRLFYFATLLLFSLGASHAGEITPRCKKVKRTQTTCWGWIKGHAPVAGGTVKQIRGRVVTPDEQPVANALIEVYDQPELGIDKRKRVAVCRVGDDGTFNFKGLSPGTYELRGSFCDNPGLDAGHTIINLAPKNKRASKREILVTLNISG